MSVIQSPTSNKLSAAYDLLVRQAVSLLENERDPVANAANLAALIYHNVDDLNWAGFYFLRENELVLGPFNGLVACTRIPLGQGVCGTAFASNETLMIEDVHAFPGHIACDAASESEVVVPFRSSMMSGVMDIDSPSVARFGEAEKALFERLTQIYVESIAPGS